MFFGCRPQFLELPFQAVECELANVCPKGMTLWRVDTFDFELLWLCNLCMNVNYVKFLYSD